MMGLGYLLSGLKRKFQRQELLVVPENTEIGN